MAYLGFFWRVEVDAHLGREFLRHSNGMVKNLRGIAITAVWATSEMYEASLASRTSAVSLGRTRGIMVCDPSESFGSPQNDFITTDNSGQWRWRRTISSLVREHVVGANVMCVAHGDALTDA